MIAYKWLQGVFGGLLIAAIVHGVFALRGHTWGDVSLLGLYGGLSLFFGYVLSDLERMEAKERDAETSKVWAVLGDVAQWQEKRKRVRTSYLTDAEWAELFEEGEALQQRLKSAYSDNSKWGMGKNDLEVSYRELTGDLERMEHARMTGASVAGAKSSSSIEDLARLRQEGFISPEEFKAFSQRFERSPGARAKDVIAAIEQLHQQFRAGAMSEGNYRASLWTLMDKLDREMR